MFIVKVLPCSTDELFTEVLHVDLTVDPAEGYRWLARGLQGVGSASGEAFEWDPSRPLYPGLQAFEEDDAAVFFGRDRDIHKGIEVLERLRRDRDGPAFVLLLGMSGCGKSSLVKAGLLPRLTVALAQNSVDHHTRPTVFWQRSDEEVIEAKRAGSGRRAAAVTPSSYRSGQGVDTRSCLVSRLRSW